jgi:molybdate transport system substrate-binding protein
MHEIVERFTAKHDIKVDAASGSSGVLTAQIQQGAPFDVFVSANMFYPNSLKESGLVLGSPTVYAQGTLILWSLDGTDLSQGIEVLASDSVSKFAIANPDIAPYGIAAMQALQRSGALETLKKKMVKGESVAQVNQYVFSGAVQVGFTSSSVLSSKMASQQSQSTTVQRHLYQPINQGIAILKRSTGDNLKAARLFHEYMFSSEARSILASHGYITS